MRSFSAGFSLIELTLILAILGLITVSLYSPLQHYGKATRQVALINLESNIRTATALAMLKYTANQDFSSDHILMGNQLVHVNVGTGIPTGDPSGIGRALNTEKFAALSIDYSLPMAVIFRTSHNKNINCSVSYNGVSGLTTISSGSC